MIMMWDTVSPVAYGFIRWITFFLARRYCFCCCYRGFLIGFFWLFFRQLKNKHWLQTDNMERPKKNRVVNTTYDFKIRICTGSNLSCCPMVESRQTHKHTQTFLENFKIRYWSLYDGNSLLSSRQILLMRLGFVSDTFSSAHSLRAEENTYEYKIVNSSQ